MKLGVSLILLLMLILMENVWNIHYGKNHATLCLNSPKTLSKMLIIKLGDSTKDLTLHTMTVKETPKCVVVVEISDKVLLDT